MMTTVMLLETAHGLIALGLHLDAWEILESLPAEDRLLPSVLALRLVICRELQMWTMGQQAVDRIGPQDLPLHREAAGRFHLAHARALCAADDPAGARRAVQALSDTWPEGSALVLACDSLALLW